MYKTQRAKTHVQLSKYQKALFHFNFKTLRNKSFWKIWFEVEGQLTNSIVLKYSIACYLRYYQKQLTKNDNQIITVLIFNELIGKCLYKEH